MDYMLLEGLSAEDIQGQIQKLIDEGWSLEGPLAVRREEMGNRFRFFQPMIRRRPGSSGSAEVEDWT